MDDHDKLTELLIKMDNVELALNGNGGPGLCTKVNSLENVSLRHTIYFQILIAVIIALPPLIIWMADKLHLVNS